MKTITKKTTKKILSKTFIAGLTFISLVTSSPSYSHEIGLQLYSLRDQIKVDMPKAFRQINTWGIKVVEGGGMLFDTPITQYKALLDKHDIAVVSVDTNFEEIRDNPISVAYKAKFFDAKYATFYWIPHEEGKAFNIDHAKSAVKVMNKAGKILKENGITLQYHPHGYEFLPYKDEKIIDYMIKNTTQAQFQMDVYWVKQAGMNPVKLLKKYPGRFTSLHLKDRRKGTANSTDGKSDIENNVILGQGDVDIKNVIKEAKKQGIRYFFIEDESSRVLQQIPQSIKFLNKLDGIKRD